MDKEKFEELCKEMMITSAHDHELFFQGYTLGFLDGEIEAMKRIGKPKAIPDAEVRPFSNAETR